MVCVRIISGTARGRKLVAPNGLTTRPIPDRAKTAIFNMILSIRMERGTPGLEGTRVLDLYAGSGSFGLECLSRGAAEAVFVERDRAAISAIRTNLDNFGLAARARIDARDVGAAVSSLEGRFDLAFCDPPYAADPWPDLLQRIPAELLIAHTEGPLPLGEDWEELRRRSYGRPHVVVARRRQ